MKEYFLPADYKIPVSGGKYFKPQDGKNKLRILTSPILGTVGWDKSGLKPAPVRCRMKEKLPDGLESPKHFWAMVVFDYADSSVKIWEITQQTIQKAIRELATDEDWGSPVEYDLTVTRTGSGMETEYMVNPTPKKALSNEAQVAFKSMTINLEALYAGDDPFGDDHKHHEGGDQDNVGF